MINEAEIAKSLYTPIRTIDDDDYPTSRNVSRLAGAIILALGIGIVVMNSSAHLFSNQSEKGASGRYTSINPLSESERNVSLSFEVTNEYPPVSSLYPWRIVEPFRKTNITAVSELKGFSTKFTWAVHLGQDSLLPDPLEDSVHDNTIFFIFKKPGREYWVTLTEESMDANDEVHTRIYKSPVQCKYVRREIRQLNEDDRREYFKAMKVLAQTDMVKGKHIYGEHFLNLQYMTKKHLYGDVCTPYHGGLSFFTSHAAFTLQLDGSLQLINPKVTQPYWDSTIDDLMYGHHWENSILWDNDWFGSLNSKNRDHILEGRFENTTYPPKDYNFSEHNAFGIMTKRTNLDPSMFVTRAHQFCGLRTDLTLPGCSTLLECLETSNLAGLHHCAEDELHGNIHNVIGGFFGCPVSLGDFGVQHSEYRDLLMNMGETASNIWSGNPHIKWPDYCSEDTQFEACRARCPNITSLILEEMDYDELYELMDKQRLAYFSNASDRSTFDSPLYNTFYDIQWSDENSKWVWAFKPRRNEPLNRTENMELMRFMINFGCNPGKYGTMSTGSATNDPVFWPIHPFFDRMWHYIRLAPEFTDFNHTWIDDSSCFGRSKHDVLPFTNLFDEGDQYYYSNADMYALFDPRNPQLKYVYDNFDWSHCTTSTSEEGLS